jgi:putative Mn2+ efflux pump MntP
MFQSNDQQYFQSVVTTPGGATLSFLLSAALLSIDSLVVSLALSPLVRSQVQRWRWAALFGICDGLAVLIGCAFGGAGWGPVVAHGAVPIFAFCCGVYCLVAACWNKFRANPRLALALPVLMSLDNLAYGAGVGPLTSGVAGRAVVLGLSSFSLAMAGFLIGRVIRSPNLRIKEWSAGFALIAAGFVLFFSN